MSTTNGYYPSPIKTRLSDSEPVPRGWKWVELRDVARLESGHTPSRKIAEYWEGGDVPWLSLKDIRGMTSRYVMDTIDKPTMLGVDNSSARVLPKGTVAFCRTASVGNVAILGRDMATSQDFVDWVCGPQLLPEFLYEAFKASGPTFTNEMQGSTHKTIYMPTVERFKILLPPLSEQKRIADILAKADAIRRKRREARDVTCEMSMATFREEFKEYLTQDGPKVPLCDIADVVSGVAKGRKLGGAETREVPYLRVANVQAGYLDLSEIKTMPAKESEIRELALQHGDVLMTEGGDHDKLGRGALWDYEGAECIHQNHVFRVRTNRSKVLPSFFVHFLQTSLVKSYFLRCAKKTTNLASINMTQLRALPVPLPPLGLQERFHEEVNKIRDVVARQGDAHKETESLFGCLIQQAFKGEL
jgi:type I restriction enzyme S subunit